MRKIIFLLIQLIALSAMSQFKLAYNPSPQPAQDIQYFKPKGNLFVGDCIPFYHNNTYYLYWLLDSGHHSALNGLGGHQWALSTSKDLTNWTHYPVVLGIDEDWEKSICTGSLVHHNNTFYAFYATRRIDSDGKVAEQLSYATSPDGIHFTKQKPNPFYTFAPGYSKQNFRDPKVVVDKDGTFHLFISSEVDGNAIAKGALVHLASTDLKSWKVLPPLISGQDEVPECPDYFKWNDWYYIVYGRGGGTYYLQSKQPYGPWQAPASQALNEDWSNVVKTAAFNNGRRIAAGWVPNKRDNKDNGREIFGGNIILREVIQDKDGALLTRFVPELAMASKAELPVNVVNSRHITNDGNKTYSINAPYGLELAVLESVPQNCVITLDMKPIGPVEDYGLYLRMSEDKRGGYKLAFSPSKKEVTLHNTTISAVPDLDKAVRVEVVMKDDIIDICVNGKRCVVNRLYERTSGTAGIFAKHGRVQVDNISINPLVGKD